MDLENAADPYYVTSALLLDNITVQWRIMASCALSGDGLFEGLSWISETLKAR
jgi:hypothetical protein